MPQQRATLRRCTGASLRAATLTGLLADSAPPNILGPYWAGRDPYTTTRLPCVCSSCATLAWVSTSTFEVS
jgi:hypothetical protein